MKLFKEGLRTITKDHIKILEAAENKDFIPIPSLRSKCRNVKSFTTLAMDLVKLKYLTYKNDSYKISISGCDALSIYTLKGMGLKNFGNTIGVGKESDIYYGTFNINNEIKEAAVKISRLGRNSFKKVNRSMTGCNWYQKNCENASIEATNLKYFENLEIPIPKLYAINRHVIVMELLTDYVPLYKLKVENDIAYKCLDFIVDFWQLGYVHGDFNEFNIMSSDNNIKVIDFPQIVRNDKGGAIEMLKRDVECIYKFFKKKNQFVPKNEFLESLLEEHNEKIEI